MECTVFGFHYCMVKSMFVGVKGVGEHFGTVLALRNIVFYPIIKAWEWVSDRKVWYRLGCVLVYKWVRASVCYWIKEQIHPFCFHPSICFIMWILQFRNLQKIEENKWEFDTASFIVIYFCWHNISRLQKATFSNCPLFFYISQN